MPRNRRISFGLLGCVCWLFAFSPLCPHAAADEPLRAILENRSVSRIDRYCLSCHDSDTLKGLINLEDLGPDLGSDVQVAERWQEVLEVPADTFLQSLGSVESAHLASHYSERGGSRKEISQKRDVQHATLLAEFLDKLKATQDADRGSLLNRTAVTFGSNISSMHTLTNCPTLLAGGGAGFVQGQHLVMDDSQLPLCNLWLSLLRGIGLETDSFGDSTGIIDDLLSA